MRILHKFAAWTLLLVLAGFITAFLLLPDKAYSEKEKRNLSQMPECSVDTLTDGSFMNEIEDYIADQFPLRDSFMSMKTSALKLTGDRESQGVYYLSDGTLAERFTWPDDNNYLETVNAIRTFAARYPDTPMYFLMAPNAISVYPEKLKNHALTDSQDAFIDDFTGLTKDIMTPVDVRESFKAQKDNVKLYYGSDHHWTTEGAYLAFGCAAADMGLSDVSEFTSAVVCNDFTGSLAAKSGFSVKTPDSITICTPANDTIYTVAYTAETRRTATCYDTSALSKDDPYQIFFGGNHPEIRIETSADSNRTLLVIKDSYANAFIPFLIPEYASITVIDPRYYYDDIDALMGSGFSEVLFLYNANTFSEDTSLKTVLNNVQ